MQFDKTFVLVSPVTILWGTYRTDASEAASVAATVALFAMAKEENVNVYKQ